jgi:hypothetical protein
MSKMKFFVAAVAALVGVGGAYASKASSAGTQHTWLDENNEIFLVRATTAQAETNCPGDAVFCARASDVPTNIVNKAD